MSSMRSASSSTRCSRWFMLRVARAHVIEQASRRRDDDVHAALEGVLLRPHPDAAEDRRAGDGGVDRQRVQILEDLRRQLTRRRQHERPRRPPRLVDETVQNRQQKRRGLAAAGLRRGDDVLALHRRGNRLRLNGGGPYETEFLDALDQRWMKPEIIEWHGALCHFDGVGIGLKAQGSGLRAQGSRTIPDPSRRTKSSRLLPEP